MSEDKNILHVYISHYDKYLESYAYIFVKYYLQYWHQNLKVPHNIMKEIGIVKVSICLIVNCNDCINFAYMIDERFKN